MVTLRRDLKDLEKENLIRLEHGSAVALNYLIGATREPRFEAKRLLNSVSKRKLAAKAIEFIKDGETIIIDAGTTCGYIASALSQKRYNNLILLTNDIVSAQEACPNSSIQVIVVGGLLRSAYYNSYGSYSEEMLSNLRADKFFLSGDAVSIDWGISNISMEEVPVKKKMIEISDKVILVADGSKFDTNAPHRICQWDTIDAVITETTVGEKYRRLFEELKLETYYDE
jgi:DeoR/GlpR family transcriptional regulator of sugar metabolism